MCFPSDNDNAEDAVLAPSFHCKFSGDNKLIIQPNYSVLYAVAHRKNILDGKFQVY